MNAILVCVDFADVLEVTLPWNRHHFKDVWVVIAHRDKDTQRVAAANNALTYLTDSFWEGGGEFRKWLALENALRDTGLQDSHDWLALLDCDVLWPKSLCLERSLEGSSRRPTMMKDQLIGPLRRMWRDWPKPAPFIANLMDCSIGGWSPPIPVAEEWHKFPIHPQQHEWAGFSLILHTDDPVLRQRPWFDTSWRSCAGGDSEFQARWAKENKVRPNWQVLHLGQDHVNWAGRTVPFANGTRPDGWEEREVKLRTMMEQRRGKTGSDKFDAEKIRD